MSFWLFLGAARFCVATTPTEEGFTDRLLETVQSKAYETNALLQSRLEEAGLEGEELAVASALLLGNKTHLEKSTRRAFASVGASHLLALSGMHLGIIYGILYALFIRNVIYTPWRWHALPPILLFIWSYVWLTGMQVSLIRAALMLSLLSVGLMYRIRFPRYHLLAMSALLILLISPEELFSVSFQLSFTAVFFILALYTPLSLGMWSPHRRRWTGIKKFTLLCFVAQLATMPLSVYYFHSFPVLGIPVSMFLIPLTSVIIYAGLICLLIPLHLVGISLGFILKYEMVLVNWCASLPFACIDNLYPQSWHIVMIYILLLILTLRMVSVLGPKN